MDRPEPPTFVEKLLYLSGKEAPEHHRAWVLDHLDQPVSYRLGVELNLGGGLLGLVVAFALLMSGGTAAAVFVVVFVILRIFLMPMAEGRTQQTVERLRTKNGAPPADAA